MAYGQRFRNNARREFNRYWADKTHPPAPNGSRRCSDCAKNTICTRSRKGNHTNCFVRKGTGTSTPSSSDGDVGAILFGLIIVVVILAICVSSCTREKTIVYNPKSQPVSVETTYRISETQSPVNSRSPSIASPYIGMSEDYIDKTELGAPSYDQFSIGGWSYTFLLDNGYALLVKTEDGAVTMIQRLKDGKLLSSTTETGDHTPLNP